MDSVFEKIGIYDLLGTFLSGAIIAHIIYYLTIIFLSPQVSEAMTPSDSFSLPLNTLSGITLSFFVGLILENCASQMEKRRWRYRQDATKLDVVAKEITKTGIAPDRFHDMVGQILDGQKSIMNANQQGTYVYQYCKIYLEANKLNTKEQCINAIYVLSRNVMMGFYGCVALCILIFLLNIGFPIFSWILGRGNLNQLCNFSDMILLLVAASFLCLIKIFKKRCKAYADYRVRVVLREYYYHAIRSKKNFEP